MRALWILAAVAACGSPQPAAHGLSSAKPVHAHAAVFGGDSDFVPPSFTVKVTGHGRPVIFIPGLGCPGAVWDDTVARLTAPGGPGIEAHVITIAGFAGVPPIKPPLVATVRHDLVRYISAHQLESPILVGHSLGGYLAYWVAATAPDQIGGAIVVDAGPSFGDDLETARALRNTWAQAGDDELPQMIRAAYTSMVRDPRRIEPFIPAITRSDREAIGNAIYELVTTDLSSLLPKIRAPVLLVLSDGGLKDRYRQQAAPVPHLEVEVVPHTGHFVMLDDPDDFVKLVEKFIAARNAPP